MRWELALLSDMDCRKSVAEKSGGTMENTAFDYKRIAEGYKKRPFLHKQVIERFQREVCGKTFECGLDIGCGAGLSAKALKMICNQVVGSDISSEMIAVAGEVCGQDEEVSFIVSKAEEIPAMTSKADIVTAAGAIQWIDRTAFLKAMKNVMAENGYMLIYDFAISDKMLENEAYTRWWHEEYLKEFPKPFRNEYIWTNDDVSEYGFMMLNQVDYEMEYEFDLEAFIEFMMIQSNVNAKIEGEGRTVEDVSRWFHKTLEKVFVKSKETVIFRGYSWYLKRE